MAANKVFVIGLTGGIAAGKSLVTKILRQSGAFVIDADVVGHQAYIPGTSCYQSLLDTFGDRILADDRTINRRALGSIVFGDKSEMKRLTDVVWPEIHGMIANRLGLLADQQVPVAVVEAAILLEADWTDLVDEVWTVAVSPELARERIIARNGIDGSAADKRIAAQMSNSDRLERSNVAIMNEASIEEVTSDVQSRWAELLERQSLTIPSSRADAGPTANEPVVIVDQDNQELGSTRRALMRTLRLTHRASFVFARNSHGKFYVQLRTPGKDYCPSHLDATAGGVVAVGESFEENAYREVEEELGIPTQGEGAAVLTHLFPFFYEDEATSVYGDAWECVYDGAITPQEEEVAAVELMTLEEMLADPRPVTPDGIYVARKYLEFKKNGGAAAGGSSEATKASL